VCSVNAYDTVNYKKTTDKDYEDIKDDEKNRVDEDYVEINNDPSMTAGHDKEATTDNTYEHPSTGRAGTEHTYQELQLD